MMFPQISPKLIVMVNYGVQSNTFGQAVPMNNLREISGMIAVCLVDGCEVIRDEDTNVAAGRVQIKNNDPIHNQPREVLNEIISGLDLKVANNSEENPTTHVDLKSGRSRALDMVITNNISKCHTDHKSTTFYFN